MRFSGSNYLAYEPLFVITFHSIPPFGIKTTWAPLRSHSPSYGTHDSDSCHRFHSQIEHFLGLPDNTIISVPAENKSPVEARPSEILSSVACRFLSNLLLARPADNSVLKTTLESLGPLHICVVHERPGPAKIAEW